MPQAHNVASGITSGNPWGEAIIGRLLTWARYSAARESELN